MALNVKAGYPSSDPATVHYMLSVIVAADTGNLVVKPFHEMNIVHARFNELATRQPICFSSAQDNSQNAKINEIILFFSQFLYSSLYHISGISPFQTSARFSYGSYNLGKLDIS